MVNTLKREDGLLDSLLSYRRNRDEAVSFLRLWAEANADDAQLCQVVIEMLTKEEE